MKVARLAHVCGGGEHRLGPRRAAAAPEGEAEAARVCHAVAHRDARGVPAEHRGLDSLPARARRVRR